MNQKIQTGHVGWSPDYNYATPMPSPVDVPRLVRVGRALDDELEHAAEHLPEEWSIRIDVERGAGSVTAIRPDGTEVDMHDGESDLSEQFRDAIRLAYDEIEADKLSDANDKEHQPRIMTMRRCENCNGIGGSGDDICPECEGSGASACSELRLICRGCCVHSLRRSGDWRAATKGTDVHEKCELCGCWGYLREISVQNRDS